MTVLTALVFGLVGVIARRSRAAGALGTRGEAGAGRVARRAASALVVCEVALAIVLLVGAGLILRSFARLLAVDPGFRTDHVLTMDVALPADRYGNPGARQAFYDRALPALGQLPGIAARRRGSRHAAYRQQLDGAVRARGPTGAAGRTPARRRMAARVGRLLPRAATFRCAPGRLFDTRDGPDGRDGRHHQRGRSTSVLRRREPVGKRVRLGQETAEIVGVVGDIRRAGLTDKPRADMYLPFEHAPQDQASRSSSARAAIRPRQRRALTNEPARDRTADHRDANRRRLTGSRANRWARRG